MKKREIEISRKTKETEIKLKLNLDGSGKRKINTGIGFLDHLFSTFACHAHFDLQLTCKGDIQVDDHHTAEDCALALGEAINKALGEKIGVFRFASAYAPLDEALARAVVDISGRPFSDVNLGLSRERIGELSTENITHVIRSLATAGMITLHVDMLKGENEHHKAEAAFKALALALRKAVARDGTNAIPSTKGAL